MDKPLERFLPIGVIKQITGKSRATIYRWVEKGNFPRPINITNSAKAWRESDVRAWEQNLTTSIGTK